MSRPRNILWLNTDQQMTANRPDVARELPLQCKLALRGMDFRRAYTALPVCSPSRASMLTGRYPHNHGLTENDGRFGGTSRSGTVRLPCDRPASRGRVPLRLVWQMASASQAGRARFRFRGLRSGGLCLSLCQCGVWCLSRTPRAASSDCPNRVVGGKRYAARHTGRLEPIRRLVRLRGRQRNPRRTSRNA